MIINWNPLVDFSVCMVRIMQETLALIGLCTWIALFITVLR